MVWEQAGAKRPILNYLVFMQYLYKVWVESAAVEGADF